MKETTMQYKTIVLELLQQRPEIHEQLRKDRKLLMTMESYARDLKSSHEAWKETLSQERPGSDPSQIASEAMELALKELALKELEDRLSAESLPNDSETLSLDAAMASIRKPTRSA
jgi:hypothetical protein